jgi:hypothetical protein
LQKSVFSDAVQLTVDNAAGSEIFPAALEGLITGEFDEGGVGQVGGRGNSGFQAFNSG